MVGRNIQYRQYPVLPFVVLASILGRIWPKSRATHAYTCDLPGAAAPLPPGLRRLCFKVNTMHASHLHQDHFATDVSRLVLWKKKASLNATLDRCSARAECTKKATPYNGRASCAVSAWAIRPASTAKGSSWTEKMSAPYRIRGDICRDKLGPRGVGRRGRGDNRASEHRRHHTRVNHSHAELDWSQYTSNIAWSYWLRADGYSGRPATPAARHLSLARPAGTATSNCSCHRPAWRSPILASRTRQSP